MIATLSRRANLCALFGSVHPARPARPSPLPLRAVIESPSMPAPRWTPRATPSKPYASAEGRPAYAVRAVRPGPLAH